MHCLLRWASPFALFERSHCSRDAGYIGRCSFRKSCDCSVRGPKAVVSCKTSFHKVEALFRSVEHPSTRLSSLYHFYRRKIVTQSSHISRDLLALGGCVTKRGLDSGSGGSAVPRQASTAPIFVLRLGKWRRIRSSSTRPAATSTSCSFGCPRTTSTQT